MKYRYIVHCARMEREQIVIVDTLHDLFREIEYLAARYGPVDLIYSVGRA